MAISIDQEHLDHIKRKVESGIYRSPDAVIAKALGLLDEHDESLAEELDESKCKRGSKLSEMVIAPSTRKRPSASYSTR